jgi:heme/copper-type cytochrome/quinol oxidase subunit 3
MSGRNVIALDQNRRAQHLFPDQSIISMLVFLIFDSMILAGMVGAFMLTRAAAGDAWPPAGRPWFPPEYMIINTAALLASAALVFSAARAWKKRQTRIGALLLAALMLGSFFILLQGLLWVDLIRQGSTLSSSPHGNLFCLIVATHGIHVVASVVFLAVVWLRVKPLRDDDHEVRGSQSSNTFWAARLLWYFTVGVWPVLYLCLYF